MYSICISSSCLTIMNSGICHLTLIIRICSLMKCSGICNSHWFISFVFTMEYQIDVHIMMLLAYMCVYEFNTQRWRSTLWIVLVFYKQGFRTYSICMLWWFIFVFPCIIATYTSLQLWVFSLCCTNAFRKWYISYTIYIQLYVWFTYGNIVVLNKSRKDNEDKISWNK